MFGIGMQELIIIMVIALLVLGPSRLPQVARTLGKGMREFRKASDDLRSAMWVDLDDERAKPHTPPPASLPAPSAAQAVAEQPASPAANDNVGSVREPSVLPAEIELAPVEKTPPQSASPAAMPRAAEGIVARGSPLQIAKADVATGTEAPLGTSPGTSEKTPRAAAQFTSGENESA